MAYLCGNVLSAKEAAKRLGVSLATVKRWFASGELNAAKVGKSWITTDTALIKATTDEGIRMMQRARKVRRGVSQEV